MRRSSKLLAPVLFFLSAVAAFAQPQPADIQTNIKVPYHFVAYGDTRFTNPSDTGAADPQIRQEIVRKIGESNPAFISIGGDISYNGEDKKDWEQYDKETAVWREQKIPVYPALGNHDLHGKQKDALANYFERFPYLHESNYYAVELPNAKMLVLDSSQDELIGSQGAWFKTQIASVGDNNDFVFIVLHHPPFTSSSERIGGGHSARKQEKELATYLEEEQKKMRARIVVFAGHVHNYERKEHGGVVYFTTGGGGAHPYLFKREKDDLFQEEGVFYHFIEVDVDRGKLTATMHRVQMKDGKPEWTEPDKMTIEARKAAPSERGVGQH